jgi:hypothetical protein
MDMKPVGPVVGRSAMVSITSEAQLPSVPEPVEQDEVRVVRECALDEPHRPALKKKTATPTEEKQPIASDEKKTQTWRALDQLLLTSFGSISPAYLFFNSLPPER